MIGRRQHDVNKMIVNISGIQFSNLKVFSTRFYLENAYLEDIYKLFMMID